MIQNILPSTRKIFRYSMASGTAAITSNNIVETCGGIAATTTSLKMWAGSIKVHSVKIWAPSVNNGIATCSVAWEGGLFGLTKTVSDTSISVTTPARVVAAPPKESTSAFWQNLATNNTLFSITTSVANTIVDVDISYIVNDNISSGLGLVVVGATVGSVYFVGLDGLAVATSKFIPIGVPTGV